MYFSATKKLNVAFFFFKELLSMDVSISDVNENKEGKMKNVAFDAVEDPDDGIVLCQIMKNVIDMENVGYISNN